VAENDNDRGLQEAATAAEKRLAAMYADIAAANAAIADLFYPTEQEQADQLADLDAAALAAELRRTGTR